MNARIKYVFDIATDKKPTTFKVYTATSPSGKQYVGITKLPLNERIRCHVYASVKPKYFNTPFSKAIRKYGIEAIKFSVIDYTDDVQSLKELEKTYISKLDTYKNGYNATLGGDGIVKEFLTEEHKKKLSDAKKRYYSDAASAEKNRQTQLDYNRLYPEKGQRHSVALKKMFSSDPSISQRLSTVRKQRLAVRENYEEMSIACGAKYFTVTSLNGKDSSRYLTQGECARALGLSQGHIGSCLRGERKSHMGYTFRYI